MIHTLIDKLSDNVVIGIALVANIGEMVMGDGNSSLFVVGLSIVTLVIAFYKAKGAHYESRAKKIDLEIKEETLKQLKAGQNLVN